MKKEYILKVLYDNGIEELYKTGEVTKEELNEVANLVISAFRTGSNGYLQLPNKDGLSTIIDLSKASRVDFLSQV